MASMTEKQRTQKEQGNFMRLLDSLDIKDRESPIKHGNTKVLGAKGKNGKRNKGRRK